MTLSSRNCVFLISNIDHQRQLIDLLKSLLEPKSYQTLISRVQLQGENQAILAEHSNGKNRAFLITFIIKTDSLLEPFNWKSTILKTFAFYQTLLTGATEKASGSQLHISPVCDDIWSDPREGPARPRKEAGPLAHKHLDGNLTKLGTTLSSFHLYVKREKGREQLHTQFLSIKCSQDKGTPFTNKWTEFRSIIDVRAKMNRFACQMFYTQDLCLSISLTHSLNVQDATVLLP